MTSTAFNISMVMRADVTSLKAGLADATSGMRNVATEATKAGAAASKEATELSQLAAAAAKAAAAQDALAGAETRVASTRAQTIIAPLANPAPQIAPLTAAFKATETAAGSLRGAVAGLNNTIGQQVNDFAHARQEAALYQSMLDDVRASFNPLFAASQQYEQQLKRIAEAERLGALTGIEAAEAKARAAQIIAPVMPGGVPGARGVRNMHTANIGAQGFDIGVTAAMGMSPAMIGLQQGTQLVQVMQQMGGGKQALQGLATGFLSILNPMSLATIGIVAFGAAGIQALMSLGGEAKTFEDAMADLSDAVASYEKNIRQSRSSTDDLAREFGSAAEEVRGLLAEMAELDRRRAQRSATEVLGTLKDDRGLWLPDLSWRSDNPDSSNNAQLFEARRARDTSELRSLFDLDRSAESNSLVGAVLDAMTRADAAKTLEDQTAALTELTVAWTAAAQAKGGFSADEDDFLAKLQASQMELQKLQADGGNEAGQQAQSIFRTYQQQLELERASLAYGKDSAEVRKLQNGHEMEALKLRLQELKVDERSLEGKRAINALIQVQAEREKAVAAEKAARALAQQDEIAGLQRELQLLGATSAERIRATALAAAEAEIRDRQLRGKEAELALTNAIAKAEAQIILNRGRAAYDLETSRLMDQFDLQSGLTHDPVARADIEAERERVRQIRSGAEAGLAGAEADRVRIRAMNDLVVAQDRSLRGQAERIQMQQLELALIGQTAEVRARVLALVEAEREITATGATGETAERMRQNARIEADLARTIEAQADAWRRVQSAGEAAIDGVLDKLRDGDVAGAFGALAEEIEKGFFDLAIRNPLKNAILGTDLGTLNDVGGLSGIWGRLTGQNAIDENAVIAQASAPVQAMTVHAASVTLAGDLSGIANLLSPAANSNTQPFAGLPGSRDVQSQIWQFFTGKGLAPHQVAGIMGQVSAESAFNPFAVGDGGTSFGLFQHHAGRGRGLLDAVGGKGGLGNVEAQLEFVWRELLTSENGVLQRLMASTNIHDATAAAVGFERPQGWSAGNPMGAHNYDGRLAAAEAAMTTFTDTTQRATGQLGEMGSGMGTFGNALGSLLGSAMSGDGKGLIGGLLGLGAQWLQSKLPGFAVGGATGGSDPTRVAGLVHEGEYVFDAAATQRIGVDNLETLRRGRMRGYATGGLVSAMPAYPAQASAPSAPSRGGDTIQMSFDLRGAQGDESVRKSVQQGIRVALEEYNRHVLPGRLKQISGDPRRTG